MFCFPLLPENLTRYLLLRICLLKRFVSFFPGFWLKGHRFSDYRNLHGYTFSHAKLCTYWLSGRAGRENIWLEVRTYGPSVARSMRLDREANIFQSLSTLSYDSLRISSRAVRIFPVLSPMRTALVQDLLSL